MNEVLIGVGLGLALCVAGGAIALSYQWISSNMRSKQKANLKEAINEWQAEVSQTAEGKTKIR